MGLNFLSKAADLRFPNVHEQVKNESKLKNKILVVIMFSNNN